MIDKISNFLIDIADKFYNSFIYEDRYLYFLEGIKNTLVIALIAVIIGFVLGTIITLIRDYHKETGRLSILNKICNFYVYIVRGTPVLLQLMILYYVVFKTVDIPIVLVGVITFGLNSAAYVSEIIRSGIEGMGKGQTEAAKTLGLSYTQTMYNIIFPQAIQKILPALGNEFITLLKDTSVAGYIGIVELLKASDIVSSRTYDYFFPLIMSALVYLFFTFLMVKIMRRIERKLNKYV